MVNGMHRFIFSSCNNKNSDTIYRNVNTYVHKIDYSVTYDLKVQAAE